MQEVSDSMCSGCVEVGRDDGVGGRGLGQQVEHLGRHNGYAAESKFDATIGAGLAGDGVQGPAGLAALSVVSSREAAVGGEEEL